MVVLLTVCLVALIASLLTFFSGFGLGTILTPFLALFFPVEVSIALTGIVHFLNNVFKLLLVGKYADRDVATRFGIPALVAAIAGAWLMLQISQWSPLYVYRLGSGEFAITPVKLVIAIMIAVFSFVETRAFSVRGTGKKWMLLGGVLSGFFGGLSGHQGAFRTAFLVNAGLTKESFIATGVVIACLVDFSRLGVYATRFLATGLQENAGLVTAATMSAFAGAFIGSRLIRKVTLEFVQKLVRVLLIALACALGTGLL